MDDGAPGGETVCRAACWGADDQAVGNGGSEGTGGDGYGEVGEMRRGAAVEDDFVHGVKEGDGVGGCRRRRRSCRRRLVVGEGYFEAGTEEHARGAVGAKGFAAEGRPVWRLAERVCRGRRGILVVGGRR